MSGIQKHQGSSGTTGFCLPEQKYLSTCQHTLGYYYNNMRVLKWLLKQALKGFKGVTGSF